MHTHEVLGRCTLRPLFCQPAQERYLRACPFPGQDLTPACPAHCCRDMCTDFSLSRPCRFLKRQFRAGVSTRTGYRRSPAQDAGRNCLCAQRMHLRQTGHPGPLVPVRAGTSLYPPGPGSQNSHSSQRSQSRPGPDTRCDGDGHADASRHDTFRAEHPQRPAGTKVRKQDRLHRHGHRTGHCPQDSARQSCRHRKAAQTQTALEKPPVVHLACDLPACVCLDDSADACAGAHCPPCCPDSSAALSPACRPADTPRRQQCTRPCGSAGYTAEAFRRHCPDST